MGNERGGSSSSSSSGRKGKKSSSDKPKQPQRGLGVAQLEKIRLHGQLGCNYHPSFHTPYPTNFNQVLLQIYMSLLPPFRSNLIAVISMIWVPKSSFCSLLWCRRIWECKRLIHQYHPHLFLIHQRLHQPQILMVIIPVSRYIRTHTHIYIHPFDFIVCFEEFRAVSSFVFYSIYLHRHHVYSWLSICVSPLIWFLILWSCPICTHLYMLGESTTSKRFDWICQWD